MSDVMSSWSRRRAAVAEEARAERAAAEASAVAQKHAELAEKPDAEVLAELGLPDPDTLVSGDDFKAFMAKAVPEHIRKRALRKLWRSNPVLACVDGLNDYDDDYLTGSTGQGVLKTTYQVGKGLMAHVREIERLAELAAAPAVSPEDQTEEAAVEEIAESAALQASPDNRTDPMPAHVEASSTPVPDTDESPAPRRMRFQFAEGGA